MSAWGNAPGINTILMSQALKGRHYVRISAAPSGLSLRCLLVLGRRGLRRFAPG